MHFLHWGMLIAFVARPADAQQLGYQMTQPVVNRPDIESLAQTPRAPWLRDDPADSLYRLGVSELTQDHPFNAASIFKRLITQYPRSKYVPEALYWHAFALARGGVRDNKIQAFHNGLASLRELRQKFRKEFRRGDAPALEQRILGELARRGNTDAARAVEGQGKRIAQGGGQQAGTNCEVDNAGAQGNDVKIAALNALMRMDARRALPTLQEVLSRRDKGSICLRRAAVLLLAQQSIEGVEATLLSTARTDPDLEVRKRSVLHLSHFNTERALSALDSIVREVKDSALVGHAIIALSQSGHPRAQAALRAYAERDNLPREARRKVIALLLQRQSAENATFFRKAYDRLGAEDLDLRRRIIQAVSQRGDSATGRWLLAIARNKSEAMELRVQALSGGARKAPIKGRIKLYAPTLDRQLRVQLVEIYSNYTQQAAALDELGEVAKRDPDSDLRRRAIDHLSQTRSVHAARVLREIIGER